MDRTLNANRPGFWAWVWAVVMHGGVVDWLALAFLVLCAVLGVALVALVGWSWWRAAGFYLLALRLGREEREQQERARRRREVGEE